MSAKAINPAKAHYQKLRVLSVQQLWNEEVPRFNAMSGPDRIENVGIIRAVGVVFSESGTRAERASAIDWALDLLGDPAEKVRRYAIAALPKLGAGEVAERALLALLKDTTIPREREALLDALRRIGGKATLSLLPSISAQSVHTIEQKVLARVERSDNPGALKPEGIFSTTAPIDILLYCRSGLENIVADEAKLLFGKGSILRAMKVKAGMVSLRCQGKISLKKFYELRCFAFLGISIGTIKKTNDAQQELQAMAQLIASPASTAVLQAFTDGPIRYRIDFLERGHQRERVRSLADSVYSQTKLLLNDTANALWTLAIGETSQTFTLEWRPRASIDTRFSYRTGDVPASSHPPLAACLARIAQITPNEIIWDPFCGSGLELIERSLLGGVSIAIGTDTSATALDTARKNFSAAHISDTKLELTENDFRNFLNSANAYKAKCTLVISNPPMGRRVPIKNLGQLISDLFDEAASALKKGGRLVFVNPCKINAAHPALTLTYRQAVDMGGFTAYLERYERN